MEEEEEAEEPKAKVKEVKMSTVVLTLFPTAVTEEKLQESKEKAITRIFGPAKTLLKVKNPQRAGDFESILKRKIDEHCQEGHLYFSQGEWEKAITCYTKALNLDPNKGQSLYEQKVYLDALHSFTHACELQPQNTLYRIRSLLSFPPPALPAWLFNDCLQMVNEEVELEKNNADLFVLRARLFEYFGKASCCFCNIQEALALDPGHVEAQLLGTLLRRLKDFSAAIDDYLKAVELCRADEASEVRHEAEKQVLLSYNDFAVHCYHKGCYEEAVQLLNKAVKGEKNEFGLYVNRGDCFLKMGQLNFAMADYQQALELPSFRPQTPPAHRLALQRDRIARLPQKVRTLMGNLFPGENPESLLSSKVGDLTKTLLDRKLNAFLEGRPLKSAGSELRTNVYVQIEDQQKAEELAAKEEKEEADEELKEARQNKPSLESKTVWIDPCPRLPPKECPKEPFCWRKN
ncbi:hypothetical protein Chor_004325 [Crotalus horridus]